MKKTLFAAVERSIWRTCHVRYQQLNSLVSSSESEDARAGHQQNFRLRFALMFKCGNAKTMQNNRPVYHLTDVRPLSEKLQVIRDKQKN